MEGYEKRFQFDNGGLYSREVWEKPSRLTDATKAWLQSLWVRIKADDKPIPYAGDWGAFPMDLTVVSEEIKTIFEELGREAGETLFDFFPVQKYWNDTVQKTVPGGPYFYCCLVARHDAWDYENTKFKRATERPEGAIIQRPFGTGQKLASHCAGKTIWRDKRSGNVYCTDAFTSRLPKGMRGMYLMDVKVTNDLN
ncbi:MAG: hypothetical protein N4A53_01400 [Pelagimonas sp.]|nr:hypothetical protein [Pelagimonas sp.]